jgi:phosphoribosylaminoimidazole-succinocarboxamide synthase
MNEQPSSPALSQQHLTGASSLAASAARFTHNTLDATNYDWLGKRYQGKVRDVYERPDALILIATDRQSAFDISWCSIPLKGQVLNQISNWWFQKIAHVMPHHVIASPDANVVVAKKLKMFQVEVVVRAYLTGTTETSAWVNYARGVRNFCGNILPENLKKNEPLPEIIVTPTTKSKEDEPIDSKGIIERGLATAAQWSQITEAALRLFREGQKVAKERGLILVDTKYEFGLDSNGVLTVGDEVHTPDSSRFWIADTYAKRFQAGEEPDSLDKEFFRRWLVSAGFNPKQAHASTRPDITDEVRAMLATKYIELYERITGNSFVFPGSEPVTQRIEMNLRRYLQSGK